MADLTYIQATLETKIVGQDATGNNANYVSADTNGNMLVKDYADGPVTPGTVASASILIGGQFNTALPTLSTTQQAAIQLDSSGRIIIAPLTNSSIVKAQLQDNNGTAIVLGQTTMSASVPVVIASNQSNIPANITQFGGVNISTGTGASGAGIPRVTVSNDSNILVTQSTSPWVDNISQFGGNNVVTGTGASGIGIPRVTVSNDSNILATQSGTWTVQQGTPPWSVVGNVASGATDSGDPVKIGGVFNTSFPTLTNGQRGDFQLDSSARVVISPLTNTSTVKAQLQDNSGTAITLGQKVSASSLPVVIASDQSNVPANITQFGGTNISTGTGTSGAGIPRVTVSNDSKVQPWDGTNTVTVKPASTAAIATDTSLVTALSPNTPLPSGTNSIGTVKAQLQDNAGTAITLGQKLMASSIPVAIASDQSHFPIELQDGSGNNITSTTINSKQRLDVNTASDGVTGSAVPFDTTQVGGSDGTNLRTFSTDTSGRLRIAASSYFHPIFTTRVQSVTAVTTVLSTSLAATIAATKAGNTIIVVACCNAGTLTVADSASQTYSTATTIAGNSTQTSKIFYFPNTAAGVTTVTISSTSSTDLNLIVTEYTGILTASPLDQTSTHGQTAATSWTSNPTTTTAQASELLIGSAMGTLHNNTAFTPGTGWGSVATVLNVRGGANLELFMEDQNVTTTGTYAATGTTSQSDDEYASIATFKYVTPNMITVINSPVNIKSGAGILRSIVVNTVGTGSASVVAYDSTSNSGTVIGNLSLLTAIGSVEYNLNFSTGLTVVANSTVADFTVVYE